MQISDCIAKAGVLVEALPYIADFRGEMVVVKLGGSVQEDESALESLLTDVAFMRTVGMKPIVVHGGGKAISRALREAGAPVKFVAGLRVTDAAAIGIVEDVLKNRAYGDMWSAFYEGAVEPFALQFSEVVTKMLFTFRERSEGSEIMATANRIQYMSNGDKMKVTETFADRGLATVNEIREIWNLPPLPPEIGDKIPARGEYYDIREGKDE